MNIDDKLNEVFGLPENEVAISKEVQEIFQNNSNTEIELHDTPVEERVFPEESSGDDIEDDYKSSRQVIKNLIEVNNKAIQQIGLIAITYENPKGFEVLGQLIKTQAELAKELMFSHKRKKELTDKGSEIKQHVKTQNNIVFNGSTSELLKAMSDKSPE